MSSIIIYATFPCGWDSTTFCKEILLTFSQNLPTHLPATQLFPKPFWEPTIFRILNGLTYGKLCFSIGETKLGLPENTPIDNLQIIVREVQPKFNRKLTFESGKNGIFK